MCKSKADLNGCLFGKALARRTGRCRFRGGLVISRSCRSGLGEFDGDVGGFDGGDGERAWLQAEFVCGLAAEQGHEPVWAGLDFYLGHYGVADNTVRHEALVRREALGTEGGGRPPRWAVAAAW